MPDTPAKTATRTQLVLGFLCIYIIWGSTYLAIRFGVATIPPFVLGAARFLIAGRAIRLDPNLDNLAGLTPQLAAPPMLILVALNLALQIVVNRIDR